MMFGFARLKALLVAVLFAVLLPVAALAQDPSGPDYAEWDQIAARAEEAIDVARASNTAFEELRTQIVTWRQNFLSAQTLNGERVTTLRAQIKALGPAPAEGETPEDAEIAQRRADLNAQLVKLQAPIIRAEEAYSRANGLIGEIDRIIRDRQTSELFTLGPSPANPVLWPSAVNAALTTTRALTSEVTGGWHNPTQRQILRDRMLPLVGMTLVGLILLGRGRAWALMLGVSLRRRYRVKGYLWQLLISVSQVAFPMIGVTVLAEAAVFTGIGGQRVEVLLQNLPYWVGILVVAKWLAGLLFNEDENLAIYALGHDLNRQARYLIFSLAIVLVLRGVLASLSDIELYPLETRAVLGLPLIGVGSLLLFRLAHILTNHWRTGGETGRGPRRLLTLMGRGMLLISILAPMLAVVGYEAAANALVFPAIRTLGPIGLVLILQKLFFEAYLLFTGDETGDEALVPVLVNYTIAIAAVPFLALIWGARPADLSEIWTRANEGISLGESRISPVDFLSFVLIFVLGYSLTRALQGTLRTTVLPKTKIDIGGQNAIVSGLGYVGIFLAALIAISSIGIDLSSLAIVAGALSVGIGFGLQNIVSNFVSGIILLIERPISLGDWIEVGGKMGYVRKISVRSTQVETFDRTDLIIPNSDLISGQVTNWTHGNLRGRVIVPVGVAYGTDTRRVEQILKEIAMAHPMVSKDQEPSIYFQNFGASSLDFEIRAVITDVNYIAHVKSDINHEIARRFTDEGIEIPFTQTDITIKNLDAWLEQKDKS